MPMLLLNWKEIVDLWIRTVKDSDEEGLVPLFECVSNLESLNAFMC